MESAINILDLPVETLYHILSYLTIPHLLAISTTSTQFLKVILRVIEHRKNTATQLRNQILRYSFGLNFNYSTIDCVPETTTIKPPDATTSTSKWVQGVQDMHSLYTNFRPVSKNYSRPNQTKYDNGLEDNEELVTGRDIIRTTIILGPLVEIIHHVKDERGSGLSCVLDKTFHMERQRFDDSNSTYAKENGDLMRLCDDGHMYFSASARWHDSHEPAIDARAAYCLKIHGMSLHSSFIYS
jgi:hypothetical protein